MPLLAPALITIAGVLLALAGMVRGVDSIVFYVFGIVDKIPWDPLAILAPIYNPAPMFVHAYRPLATLLVKLGGAIFGHDLDALRWFGFAHALLLVPFGLAARYCLRAHGVSDRIATLSALSSMALPSVLFSAWTIPEFDAVGAIWVLMALGSLRLERRKTAAVFIVLSLLTKETTAVLMFACLLGRATVAALREPSPRGSHSRGSHFVLPGAYFAAVLAVVSPLLFGEGERGDASHAFNVGAEGFNWARPAYMALHGANQFFYVLGAAGASLLVLSALRGARPWVTLGLALLPWLAPIVRVYNHYESVTVSSWLVVVLTMAPAFVALVTLALRAEPDRARLAASVVFAALGILGGPILASGARADVSARLFAPVLPLLHALVWLGAADALARVGQGGLARISRAAVALLAVAFGWLPVAGAVNAWQFTQARFAVEAGAKLALIDAFRGGGSDPKTCPLVLYTNRDQELAQEELAVWGKLPQRVTDCILLVQLATTRIDDTPLQKQRDALDGYDQRRESFQGPQLITSLAARQPPFPVHLYVQGARSTMSVEANRALNVDFTWAEERMPDVLVDTTTQAIGMTYTPVTSLERFFDEVATKKRHASSYFQLPLWLYELPARAAFGAPLVESYQYAVSSYLAAPAPP